MAQQRGVGGPGLELWQGFVVCQSHCNFPSTNFRAFYSFARIPTSSQISPALIFVLAISNPALGLGMVYLAGAIEAVAFVMPILLGCGPPRLVLAYALLLGYDRIQLSRVK